MPTSDADRYELLLKNYKDLVAGVGVIREAIERAFDVRLLPARTLNGEFEILARAIYAAAADQPRAARPGPIIGDQHKTRTHFQFRVDRCADDGQSILEHLASAEDFTVAKETFRAACERWPDTVIKLRQGARVVEDSRRSTTR